MRIALVLAGLLLVAGCGDGQAGRATDPGGAPSGGPAGMPTAVPAASGQVSSGLVTVLDAGRPELCLGAVAESYPPQCGGPPIAGWDWADRHGLFEHAGAVRWGAFAVTGGFDGTTFTVTGVVPAALYDAAAPAPVRDGAPARPVARRELDRIQHRLEALPGLLTSDVAVGRIRVEVVHDDGSIQAWADRAYGEGVVLVTSALVDEPGS